MESEVVPQATHLHTDSAKYYGKIAHMFAIHSTVDPSIGEYVSRGGATTNHAETYFSRLQRSLDGTHHHVSVEHLDRYLAEFDWRYTTCKQTDTERMKGLEARLVGGG